MAPDPAAGAAEPAHLTAVLRGAGVLGAGDSVREVAVESDRLTTLSRILRLRLAYDAPAVGAPATMILKTAHPDRIGGGWNAGPHEVAFYERVAGAVTPPTTPRCFEAQSDEASGAWHLLLEDLSGTHVIATAWPLPPTTEDCARIVAARARFHAALWDHPEFGRGIGAWFDQEGYVQRFADVLARFLDRFGPLVPAERRELYERLLAAPPRMFERQRSRRHLTILHGDAHVWNCFLPRDGGEDLRLFDWDSWRMGVGASDLAYMMAIHWYPDRRALLEAALLDRYHEALLAHGVRGYDRAMLAEDYRRCVLWQATTPVWQAVNGIPPVIWWNNLERVMLAVEDLGCRDLLTA